MNNYKHGYTQKKTQEKIGIRMSQQRNRKYIRGANGNFRKQDTVTKIKKQLETLNTS